MDDRRALVTDEFARPSTQRAQRTIDHPETIQVGASNPRHDAPLSARSFTGYVPQCQLHIRTAGTRLNIAGSVVSSLTFEAVNDLASGPPRQRGRTVLAVFLRLDGRIRAGLGVLLSASTLEASSETRLQSRRPFWPRSPSTSPSSDPKRRPLSADVCMSWPNNQNFAPDFAMPNRCARRAGCRQGEFERHRRSLFLYRRQEQFNMEPEIIKNESVGQSRAH
jgi:hypothetical protein